VMDKYLHLDGVGMVFHKRDAGFEALRGISLNMKRGEFVTLIGHSGCGKSTLLNLVAGLLKPSAGFMLLNNKEIAGPGPDRGVVFQNHSLLPWLTCTGNVLLAVERVFGERETKAQLAERTRNALGLVGLANAADKYPDEISGGMKQRVGIARALAMEPRMLLLDEPFGALDAKVRTELRQWLRRLHDEIHVTSVFVTHDQEEAFEVADRVVIMNKGRIEQVGSPTEIFERPANPFVMDFLGNVNVFRGHVEGGKTVLRPSEVPPPDSPHAPAGTDVYVRPHELAIEHKRNGEAAIEAKVVHVNPTGSRTKIELKAVEFDQMILAELTSERYAELGLKAGDVVFVSARRAHVFTANYSI
jgi:sulfate transport system ATP-binding protein